MIIYKTTNLINNKIYVGQSKNDDKNYLGSGTYIIKSIKKYGRSNFKKEILENCETPEQLNDKELYWINLLNSTDKKIGYNVRTTIQGVYSEESRKNQIPKGPMSKETKQKISRALSKRPKTKEHIENMIKGHLNIDHSHMKSLEYREKMSKAVSGDKNGMYGKSHSKETKEKISKSKIGKEAWNKGKDGSSYYTSMLKNYLNKLKLIYDVTNEELISNIDFYVKKAKLEKIIPKNKGISLETLKKYNLT
jgi:group I intron endonuclease